MYIYCVCVYVCRERERKRERERERGEIEPPIRWRPYPTLFVGMGVGFVGLTFVGLTRCLSDTA